MVHTRGKASTGPEANLAEKWHTCLGYLGWWVTSKLHDKAVEIAIFGAFGGVSGASIGLLWIAGVKAEHIFSLAGAIIGAAAAVGGAAWLSDRNARIAHRREVDLLEAECTRIKLAVDEAVTAIMMDGELFTVPISGPVREVAFGIKDTCAEFPALIQEALQQAKTLSFDQRAKLSSASGAVHSYLSFRDAHASNNFYGTRQDWHPILAGMSEKLGHAEAAMRNG